MSSTEPHGKHRFSGTDEEWRALIRGWAEALDGVVHGSSTVHDPCGRPGEIHSVDIDRIIRKMEEFVR